MNRQHNYNAHLVWTGNLNDGTRSYHAYSRDCEATAPGCPPIHASADRAFRGDPSRWNPELLLVAALSQCHLLSYLHCCATAGVVVAAYEDDASGVMAESEPAGGRFIGVTLRPSVTVEHASMVDEAQALHHLASKRCFLAASMNFPVSHDSVARAGDPK